MSWVVQRCRGRVGDLHHLDLPAGGRSAWVLDVTMPSVALGSTQSADVLAPDVCESLGLDLTRRHSGGGLVRMNPGEVAWVDLLVPAGDRLWRDDVGEAFGWIGDLWADTLSAFGLDAEVHRGRSTHVDLGRIVCFAGMGSGEVSVGGVKVVGMSQRRTRDWARFQCLVHGRFDSAESLELLAPEQLSDALVERLANHVGTVDDLDSVVEEFLARLAEIR